MRSISARFHESIVFERTKLRCTPASTHSTTQVHACEYSQYRQCETARPTSASATALRGEPRLVVLCAANRSARGKVTPQCHTLQRCNAARCSRTESAVAAAALDAHDHAAATREPRAYGPHRTRWHFAVSESARRHYSAIIVQL